MRFFVHPSLLHQDLTSEIATPSLPVWMYLIAPFTFPYLHKKHLRASARFIQASLTPVCLNHSKSLHFTWLFSANAINFTRMTFFYTLLILLWHKHRGNKKVILAGSNTVQLMSIKKKKNRRRLLCRWQFTHSSLPGIVNISQRVGKVSAL